jgi:hypothetical protein
MQITIKGELTLAEIRQALYEKLHELEDHFAVSHSQGATLYVNPTNGVGDAVVPHQKDGRALHKLHCNGPYKSAADDLKV